MKRSLKKFLSTLLILGIFLGYLPKLSPNLNSATLTGGSVTLSDSRPSNASTSNTIDFYNVTTSAIKCINVAFKDAATGGSKPTGMTITGAALSGSSDYIPTPGSWSVSNNNTTGVSSITFATGETPASASDRTVILTGITNGSTTATTYYVQFATYNNTDCSSSPVDSGTIAFIYTDGQAVSATVDPSLSFSISAVSSSQSVNGATTTDASTTTTIPFGTLSASANQIVAHDLVVGTNAQNGYTVTIKSTGALSSGSHDMADHSGSNASPSTFSAAGTEAFGYTTEDTTLGTGTAGRFGSGNWAAFTTSPLEVAYSAAAASETTRTGYQVGIASTTQAGSYSTTVVYTATPTY
jgi:hypothetical protein